MKYLSIISMLLIQFCGFSIHAKSVVECKKSGSYHELRCNGSYVTRFYNDIEACLKKGKEVCPSDGGGVKKYE